MIDQQYEKATRPLERKTMRRVEMKETNWEIVRMGRIYKGKRWRDRAQKATRPLESKAIHRIEVKETKWEIVLMGRTYKGKKMG